MMLKNTTNEFALLGMKAHIAGVIAASKNM